MNADSRQDVSRPRPDLAERTAAAERCLTAAGQEHVLRFHDALDSSGRERLLGQIEAIDWEQIRELIATHVRRKPTAALPRSIEPVAWYPHRPPQHLEAKYGEARSLGARLAREGKVAAFTVAGGQGTRLGWDGPKGTFPATPIRRLPLFGCLVEYIRKVRQKYGARVPWYIMTSPANDAETRCFLDAHDHFGLDADDVMIFPQSLMPALEKATGRVLLEAPDCLALSPNGHGGSLVALARSGALDDMKRRGIEQISYTQVDNPNARVVDPLFIGLHALDGCQMSSKALAKTSPAEQVGVFAIVDGRVNVIEYSDLPPELAVQRGDDGELKFGAGSIAIHVIRTDFVESINRPGSAGLPFHRAEKKVPCLDFNAAETIEPSEPNAVKLEMFVFDALAMCDRSIVYESDRIDEFAPIKNGDKPNASESVDSPTTSRRIQTERAARWLEAIGVTVPRDAGGRVDATIEISALTALEAEDLRSLELPERIEPGAELLI